MDEILIHAENECRKILHPSEDFSPRIHYWYNKINAYEVLIYKKESNKAPTYHLIQKADCKGINNVKEPSIK